MGKPFRLSGATPEGLHDKHSLQNSGAMGEARRLLEESSLAASAQRFLETVNAPPHVPTAEELAQQQAEYMLNGLRTPGQRSVDERNERYYRKLGRERHAQKMAEIHAAEEARGVATDTPTPRAVQPWARAWQGNFEPLFRVLGGAGKLGTIGEMLDGLRLSFATTDLCEALRRYDDNLHTVVPQKSNETLSKQLRALYPGFEWAKGNGGADREALIEQIKDAYAEGKILADDEELDEYLPENIRRLRPK